MTLLLCNSGNDDDDPESGAGRIRDADHEN